MSIQALRQAINAESDDPHAILQVLQVPWNGALNRRPYTDLLVVCAIKRKVEQIKMLGLLGADITAISTPGIRIKQAPKEMDELQQRAAACSRR